MFVSYSLLLPSKQKLKHTKLPFLASCYSDDNVIYLKTSYHCKIRDLIFNLAYKT